MLQLAKNTSHKLKNLSLESQNSSKELSMGAAETAQQLIALIALTEKHSAVPTIYIASHRCLEL